MEQLLIHELDYDHLLDCAVSVGQSLLENGAEIYRVEESISRIIRAYGVKDVDVFAIPSCIIVSLSCADGTARAKTKRILSRNTNLDRVSALNALCRRICAVRPPLAQIPSELNQIQNRKVFPFPVQVLGYALVSFAFTLFFGGSFADAVCSLILGALIKLVLHPMVRVHTNPFFINIVASAFAAALAFVAVHLGIAAHLDKIIIGTFMTMVPGVAITNSMRDIIAGDLIAGGTKLVEALLVATAMALGAGIALSIGSMIIS